MNVNLIMELRWSLENRANAYFNNDVAKKISKDIWISVANNNIITAKTFFDLEKIKTEKLEKFKNEISNINEDDKKYVMDKLENKIKKLIEDQRVICNCIIFI